MDVDPRDCDLSSFAPAFAVAFEKKKERTEEIIQKWGTGTTPAPHFLLRIQPSRSASGVLGCPAFFRLDLEATMVLLTWSKTNRLTLIRCREFDIINESSKEEGNTNEKDYLFHSCFHGVHISVLVQK